MKKIILLLIFPLFSQAETKIAKTPFWQAQYNEDAELALRPLTKGLAKDCKAFHDFVFDGQQKIKVSAEELANARNLPLAGVMRDTYVAVFEVSQGISLAASDPGVVVNADVSVVGATLTNLQSDGQGLLQKASQSLHLATTELRLLQVEASPRPQIEISGRDLACDLLNHESLLTGTAQYQVSLPADDILRLNKFYTRVEGIVLSSLSDSNLPWRQAVSLGYRLGQLYDRQKKSDLEMRESLLSLLQVLFLPETFTPGENWQNFGSDSFITYPKSVLTGLGPVQLKM